MTNKKFILVVQCYRLNEIICFVWTPEESNLANFVVL